MTVIYRFIAVIHTYMATAIGKSLVAYLLAVHSLPLTPDLLSQCYAAGIVSYRKIQSLSHSL